MKTQILFVFFYYASVKLLTSKGTSDALKLWWIVFVAVNVMLFFLYFRTTEEPLRKAAIW